MDVDQPPAIHYDDDSFYAFKGEGKRLDGKKIKESSISDPPAHAAKKYIRGIPDYDHDIFELRFERTSTKPKPAIKSETDEDQFKAFQGEGQSLKSKKQ